MGGESLLPPTRLAIRDDVTPTRLGYRIGVGCARGGEDLCHQVSQLLCAGRAAALHELDATEAILLLLYSLPFRPVYISAVTLSLSTPALPAVTEPSFQIILTLNQISLAVLRSRRRHGDFFQSVPRALKVSVVKDTKAPLPRCYYREYKPLWDSPRITHTQTGSIS